MQVFALRTVFGCSALALAVSLGSGQSVAAPAATETATRHDAVQRFDIAPQALASALNQFSAQTGWEVGYAAELARGVQSQGVQGEFQPAQAAAQLLAGTGLGFDFSGPRALILKRLPDEPGALELSTTSVTGTASLGGLTEHTGSYTTGAVTVGGKAPHSLRETPQSVSVITRQRMEDQGLTSLAQVLDQTTGITLVGGNDANTMILSRGFNLTNIQVDGGAPAYREQTYDTLADTTAYDHIQVLRGSDGLFGGTGEPAGAINLVRKRALAETQLKFATSAGSWDNYRTEVDVTGPLGFDGALRGRLAASHEDKRYFYDGADSEKHVLYGVLEADLTPDTQVSVGGTHEWRDMDGYWENGLPRFTTGDPLGLSRSTKLSADWSSNNYRKTEAFLKADHRLGDDWKINASFTRGRYDTEQDLGQIEQPINPDDLAGTNFQRFIRGYTNDQDLFDANLQGTFAAFGRSHELLFGVDYSDIKRSYSDHSDWESAVPVDIFTTDIGALPKPARPPLYYENPDWNIRKSGAYSTLRLHLADPLKLIVGARYSDFANTVSVLVPAFGTDRKNGGRESGILTPYGGIVYELNPAWSLYTSYAQIYKPQTEFLDRAFAPLEAITGDTYEVGAKGELFGGRLNLSSALYYTQQENNAIQLYYEGSSSNNCCYVAGGEIVSKGLDTEISGELAPGWQLTAGYTFNINEQRKVGDDTAVGKPISTQTPKHLFKFFTTYQLPGGLDDWKLGLGATIQSRNYVSGNVQRRLGDGSLSPSTNSYDYTQPGYAVWNALVEYRIDEHWTAALNGNNLLDKTYYQTVNSSARGNWYGAPRNYMLTLRGSF
ncbi:MULTISPECIES: TonB-dependent siderophore receptor [unclassified Pseudomonas]|uniref:TonB-dependent siderophore receptor n=1 Tax=unclassified Pseudomonas TaxID=196821 RepID=UPI002448B083|nr:MULTISPECIES: TonB-dependent siderophore receptor [unclassified Pseudomonas]MDH0897168.1 TonB-dependent siderophore receptor [Pseudomonas sp. GD03875]MDH1067564.1 TonB-dependent siderophore receptor [Pseudomonas sp. GD03985]